MGHWKNSFQPIRVKKIQRKHAVDTNDILKFNPITEIDIFRKLSFLNTRKACGCDQQPPRLQKLSAPILSFYLL